LGDPIRRCPQPRAIPPAEQMIKFTPQQQIRKVLVIGAHSDDIEIGAGGTLLQMLRQYPGIDVCWVVLTAPGERRAEAQSSAEHFLDAAATTDIRIETFRERYFPHQPEIKEYFDRLGAEFHPDIVICPWQRDAHQDHRTASELTLNTFRDQPVMQYEVVKVDGDLGRPNLYVNLQPEIVEQKVSLLLDMFPSQRSRQWFESDVFKGIMRIRGVEGRSESGFAEAFHCSQLVVGL